MTSQPPDRLKRYSECKSRGARSGRVAYVLKERNLPEHCAGDEWVFDTTFNAAQEILRDPSLKDVFKAAIDKGVKVVEWPAE